MSTNHDFRRIIIAALVFALLFSGVKTLVDLGKLTFAVEPEAVDGLGELTDVGDSTYEPKGDEDASEEEPVQENAPDENEAEVVSPTTEDNDDKEQYEKVDPGSSDEQEPSAPTKDPVYSPDRNTGSLAGRGGAGHITPGNSANRLMGIDISHWQSDAHVINWQLVKEDNVAFAFTKISEGASYIDSKAKEHVAGARSVDIPTGGYHFARPNHPVIEDARQEAQHFISALEQAYGSGNYGRLYPVLDLEAPYPKGAKDLSTTDLVAWGNEFRRYFKEKTGVSLILYTGNWFVEMWDDFNHGTTGGNPLMDMPLWVADYHQERIPAGGWNQWLLWQFTDQGRVNGIKGDVDLNVGPADINQLLIK